MRGSGFGPAAVEEWLEIAPHGRGACWRFKAHLSGRGIAQVNRLLGVRGGIWLVHCCGVLAAVSEPPPLPFRPFEKRSERRLGAAEDCVRPQRGR
jgi:hypothetical protein